jgi:hypothetical protein
VIRITVPKHGRVLNLVPCIIAVVFVSQNSQDWEVIFLVVSSVITIAVPTLLRNFGSQVVCQNEVVC